jgi:hypothetical protein
VTYEVQAKFTVDKNGKAMADTRTLSIQVADPTEILVTTLCWTVVNRRNTKNLIPNPALKDVLYSRARFVLDVLDKWVSRSPDAFNDQVAKVLRKTDYQPMTPLEAREEQVATVDLGDGVHATWVAH